MTSNDLEHITHNAVIWTVKHTRYSMYQVLRTLAVVNKYGEKSKYHMSKKQQDIYGFLETAIQVQLIGQEFEENKNEQ